VRIAPTCLLALALPAAGAGAAPPNPWLDQGRQAVQRARALDPAAGCARNAILFVGDGMGLTTVTAARILEGQRAGGSGEEHSLAFEALPHVALVKTYNTDQQVADSAGSITALTTGAKTQAGVIGLDAGIARGDAAAAARHRLPTLFEQAEDRGLATGIVTTTTVTHATPAGAYGHAPERGWEDDSLLSEAARAADFPDFARQLVEWPHGDGLDVVLGGGRRHFQPVAAADPEHREVRGARRDGRDLVAEWAARGAGSKYVWNQQGLDAVDPAKTRRLLGLFEPRHMNFEVDRAKDPAGEPSLAHMTRAAIELLARNRKGFVLMVEGGRIDHAHHSGNAHRALVDTIAFSDAVRIALAATNTDDTLVVVTADHGHVLTVGGYPTRGNPILGVVVENDDAGKPQPEPARDRSGSPYTTLGYHNGPGARDPRTGLSGIDTTQPDFLQEAAIPLDAETHSGEDVPVYAGGPGAALFHGVQEQSYVYHAMVDALGWNGTRKCKSY
jgi:alkaline phosphatase